jgi:hypothetical protein
MNLEGQAMTETRGERRAETAKQNDDSDLIRDSDKAPRQSGRSGGNLQADVATQSEEERIRDAEAHEGVTKEDDIARGQRTREPRPASHVVTERD